MNKITSNKTEIIERYNKQIITKRFAVSCYETYTNYKLTHQYFTTKDYKHNGYKSKDMKFRYYGKDVDLIEWKRQDMAGNYDNQLKPILVHNLETFSSFDQLICNWLGMDGHLYTLTKTEPVRNIVQCEIQGSAFDLDASEEFLSTLKDISNVGRKSNCYPNWDSCGKESIWFTVLPSIHLHKKLTNVVMTYERNDIIFKHLKLDKFKLSPKKNIHSDESYDDDYDY